jgi:hypothetical protein
MYFKAMEDGSLDQFNYPRKGKNIPPPKQEFEEEEGKPPGEEQQEGEYQGEEEEGDPNQIQLYDENG